MTHPLDNIFWHLSTGTDDADCQGRGHAQRLMLKLVRRQPARGETGSRTR